MPLPLLKTSEAAKVLKVSEASVRRWIEAGHLKASYFDLGGKRVYRIAQADLQAFVEGNAAANGRELGASIDLGFIEIPDMGT